MKRIVVIFISAALVLTTIGLSYSQTSGAKWPPKPMASAAVSCESNLGAVYSLSGGKTDIYCATKTSTGGYTNLKTYNCVPQGAKLNCGRITVNSFDVPAVKMQKVCAPTCTAWK
jgi:hypothetical protein